MRNLLSEEEKKRVGAYVAWQEFPRGSSGMATWFDPTMRVFIPGYSFETIRGGMEDFRTLPLFSLDDDEPNKATPPGTILTCFVRESR